MAGCSAAGRGSGVPDRSPDTLARSSAGVCAALLALPDEGAASRAFTNLAHEALHGLAGDPRLARSTAAAVLRSMTSVEDDFATPGSSRLATDLATLHDVTDEALVELGGRAPACPQ